MNGYLILLILLMLMLGVFLGVTTRFFNNFGANLAKNRMNELGVDLPEMPEDETDERLR